MNHSFHNDNSLLSNDLDDRIPNNNYATNYAKCKPYIPLHKRFVNLVLSSRSRFKFEKHSNNSEIDSIQCPNCSHVYKPSSPNASMSKSELEEHLGQSIGSSIEYDGNFSFKNRSISVGAGSKYHYNRNSNSSKTNQHNRQKYAKRKQKSHTESILTFNNNNDKKKNGKHHSACQDFEFDSNDLEYFKKNYSKSVLNLNIDNFLSKNNNNSNKSESGEQVRIKFHILFIVIF
jgi:hypothetical protein